MSLNPDAQLRYMIQWFEEWSDLQRGDFEPIMVEKLTNTPYVNGIVNSLSGINCHDKPMSLFECRVKLFREWYQQWTPEHRERLVKQISEIDPAFGERLNGQVQNGHSVENGIELAENEV